MMAATTADARTVAGLAMAATAAAANYRCSTIPGKKTPVTGRTKLARPLDAGWFGEKLRVSCLGP